MIDKSEHWSSFLQVQVHNAAVHFTSDVTMRNYAEPKPFS
jgi:hypothetical protein